MTVSRRGFLTAVAGAAVAPKEVLSVVAEPVKRCRLPSLGWQMMNVPPVVFRIPNIDVSGLDHVRHYPITAEEIRL